MSVDPTQKKLSGESEAQTGLSSSASTLASESNPNGWMTTEPVSVSDLSQGVGYNPHAPATLTTLMGRSFGKRYRLGAETLIGRASDCTIRLSAVDASRRHARILRQEDGSYTLSDLGSHNGTRVDGERITEYTLRAGDRVAIGAETVFLFSLRSREEEEVVEVQKMESMGQLAGGIAHDFNNLLAAIIGNAELALECVTEGAEPMPLANECLDDVLAAADRARELVRQLLGFARRGNWEEAPADVAVVVGEVLKLLSRTFDPNIIIDVDTADGLFVVGDRSQLFQMLMNLCINSRDAMAGGGKLTVTAKLSEPSPKRDGGRQVLITVRDTGQGMDEEIRERIFEPFFSTKERGRGTGLGLAVVYGIVTSHGGRIWAESEAGVGTEFHVVLPAMDRAPQKSEEMTATVRPGVLAETRNAGRDLVLVIDDEAVVRRSLGRMLQSMDLEVVGAEDGPTGVELYREHSERIALVVLDLIMPGMDGEQVMAVLLGINPRVRVLIVSGYHDDAKVNTLSSAGAAGFLPKPFTGAQLRFTIEAALAKQLLEE